jgi:transcriptional regulator with XRE-family HTH domain
MALDLHRLGENIRGRRTSRGWSLGELAEKTGLSKAYLSDLENGQGGRPNIQYLLQVATALETTIDALIKGADDASSAERPDSIDEQDVLPAGLRQFAVEASLARDEIQMLAQLHFRGGRPRDAEAWRAIYQVIKAFSGNSA